MATTNKKIYKFFRNNIKNRGIMSTYKGGIILNEPYPRVSVSGLYPGYYPYGTIIALNDGQATEILELMPHQILQEGYLDYYAGVITAVNGITITDIDEIFTISGNVKIDIDAYENYRNDVYDVDATAGQVLCDMSQLKENYNVLGKNGTLELIKVLR